MPLLFNIHKQGLFLDVIVISRSTASAPATTARARNNLADIFSSFYNKKKKKEEKTKTKHALIAEKFVAMSTTF